MRRHLSRITCITLWTAAIAGGMFALAKHAGTPGHAAASAGNPMIGRRGGEVESSQMELWMFIHPQCPCSAASVAELSQLVNRCGWQVKVSVFVFQAGREPTEWNASAIWSDARAIAGVKVLPDPEGLIAKRAGVKTSGQVLLFRGDGVLLFSGGITGSRGHVGDNDGLDTVTNIILGGPSHNPRGRSAPVFGCSLD